MHYPYIVLITISLFAWSQAKELYSDKYDYVNIDEVLANERLRDQYFKCLMETAPCLTPEAVFFKEHIPEAFATNCAKCTEYQKASFDKVAAWFVENDPPKWKALVEKLLTDFQKEAPK